MGARNLVPGDSGLKSKSYINEVKEHFVACFRLFSKKQEQTFMCIFEFNSPVYLKYFFSQAF